MSVQSAKRLKLDEPLSSSDDEFNDIEEQELQQSHSSQTHSMENLYFETINRNNLDFDFEKVCSVSLSNVNVYGCLVCGKYYQGRGKSSFAYIHSIDYDHHVFINLSTKSVYLLPENQEAKSNSLNDIKYLIDPTYSSADISKFDAIDNVSYDLKHNQYQPGYIGLNNISDNDYSNVILQSLSHIKTLRNYFVNESHNEIIDHKELNKRFGLLIRKIWSPKLFKSHISPHELLQYVDIQSNKAFTLNKQTDPKKFLVWLLNNLHTNFIESTAIKNNNKSTKKSIISACFQGKLQITTQKLNDSNLEEKLEKTSKVTRFWMLTLNVPEISVFKSGLTINKIPQISFSQLLSKYNGIKESPHLSQINYFKIVELPKYLIFHIDRSDLQNQTVVKFPMVLDMAPYYEGKDVTKQNKPINYKLISNISYEIKSNDTFSEIDKNVRWKIQLEKPNKEWVSIENLEIKEIEKELIFLNQTYLQIWERI